LWIRNRNDEYSHILHQNQNHIDGDGVVRQHHLQLSLEEQGLVRQHHLQLSLEEQALVQQLSFE
jgi:hypothetical protein